MVRIKKYTAVACTILMTSLFLGACGGQEKQTTTAVEDVLLQTTDENTDVANAYKTDTAIKGEFYEEVKMNGNYYIREAQAARVSYEYGKMIFDEFLVKNKDYVMAGDPIASVRIEVSDADIKEVQLRIQRMEERLAFDRQDYAKDDKKAMEDAYAIKDPHAQGIAVTSYLKQKELHDQNIATRERTITDQKEILSKMEEAKNMTAILAPCDGYVSDLATYSAGNEVKDKTILALVSNQKSNLIEVNNSQEDFKYGQQVEVTITGKTGEETMIGTVISPSIMAGEVAGGSAVIQLPKTIEEMPEKKDVKKILVTLKAGKEENAVMIKLGSLQVEKNNVYASVLTEDGSIVKRNVIIGGTNKEYYWVLKGLEEGDTVVIP